MEKERIVELAEKIKNQTASEAELTEFTREMTQLLKGIREDIKQ
jgi:uncharacterized protein YnzC (UPF0291/DUF896 family)